MSAVNGTRIYRPGVSAATVALACDADRFAVANATGEDDLTVTLEESAAYAHRLDLWVGYSSKTEPDRSQSQPQQIVSWVQLVTEGGAA